MLISAAPALETAHSVPLAPPLAVPPWVRRGVLALIAALDWCLGVVSLVALGAALAVVPVVQFVVLGYLLAASGRVARSGRLRDALVGVRAASRFGRIALVLGLGLLPARFLASLAASAEAIDPGGPLARRWHLAALVALALTAGHVALASARGGRLGPFLWPPGNLLWLLRRHRGGVGWYVPTRDAACRFVARMTLPGLARLGALGAAGTLAWLAVPFALLVLGRRATALGIVGGISLILLAPTLAFAQVRMAAEGRFGAIFEVRAVRERFRRAPWAFALAFLGLVLAAGPLYLFKIEMVPREVAGLESVLFLAALAPARIACGWAYARGERRATPRPWWARASGRLVMLVGSTAYVLVVVLAQYTSWDGIWGLVDQHAFLLPAPSFRP